MSVPATARRPYKASLFWLTVFVLALTLALTSRLVTELRRVQSASDVEIVSDPLARGSVGPEPSRLPGLPVHVRDRQAIPMAVDLHDNPGLKRVRYRISLDGFLSRDDLLHHGEPREPGKALLFSQALDGMDVYLNGVWIGGLPASDLDHHHRWFRPLRVPLARKLLNEEGANVVIVELRTWEPRLVIGPIYIGDLEGTMAVYELILFIGSSLANASNLFCLLAGVFMLGVWRSQRKEGLVYAHAGATTVVWAVLYTLLLLPYVPVAWMAARQWLEYVCMGAVITLLTLFVLEFIGEPLRRRWLLVGMASLAPLLYPALPTQARYWLDLIWLPALLAVHLYACARLALRAARTRDRASVSLLAQSVFAQVLAFHDYNANAQLIVFAPPDSGWSLSHLLVTPLFLSHLGLPLLLVVVSQILLERFRQNVRRVRDANQVLTRTLDQRERELALSYERQREMESEAAAQAERDRIYRELHDGLGSKLVTTLFSVRDREINHQQLEARLLAAMADVRDIISSTVAREERSIQDVLFSFGTGLDEALRRQDFHVELEIELDVEVVLLGDLTRQLMRIVEETTANSIKYSRASRLGVRLRIVDHATLVIEICDGDHRAAPGSACGQACGSLLCERVETESSPSQAPTSPSPLSGGKGLAGMRRRAIEIGADYRFERHANGAYTSVTLPLVQPSTTPTKLGVTHRSLGAEAAQAQH